jgi:hypothetical protein
MLRSVILVSALFALAACGDPLAGLDRISDVELAREDGAAQVLPSDAEIEREGFFGTSAAAGGDGAVIPAQGPEGATAGPEPKTRGGLLGLFRRDDTPADVTDDAPQPTSAEDPAPQADVQIAALDPEPKEKPRRGGFFGLGGRATGTDTTRDGPDARDVPYGTVLPYGIVARVCEAKGKSLGQKIEDGPAKGYALYDTASGSATARTFYITGFSDGCPRQLTAANVLLGAASLYEQLHYGPGGENLAVAETDTAYEKVKRQVCGARNGKPCGAKISKMDRNTFFVSAYDSFGNSNRWTELLVHDGVVLAVAVKTNS